MPINSPAPETPQEMSLSKIPALEMKAITKKFGTLKANNEVDISLGCGSILGLLGENGAGKTTLMNVLFGAYRADSGIIKVDGVEVNIRGPADALALGIGMVHQHFHLSKRLTVLENLLVGLPSAKGMLNRKKVLSRLVEINEQYGVSVSPSRIVGTLSVGEQQRVEIIKALLRGARILILDEPTAVLTPIETEKLMRALKEMAAKGMSIILITHRLPEIMMVANKVVVLRHGSVTGCITDMTNVKTSQLAQMMCGFEIINTVKAAIPLTQPLLALKNIKTKKHNGRALHDVSLEVFGGEILGIAGVTGNGQKELADVIAGLIYPSSGQIIINGKKCKNLTPKRVQKMGVGRIPEDRMTSGLITSLPISDSMILPYVSDPVFSKFGFLRHKAIREFVVKQIKDYNIRCTGPDTRAGNLSGGNLQKTLLARELSFNPRVILAAQPTRGLDVGAARFVYDRLLELRAKQCALIIISEDLDELLLLSDRIAVMYNGSIVDTLPVGFATVARLGMLMTSGKVT